KRLKRRGPRLTGVSKQRKKANARERNRVSILNNYIQLLRTLIPEPEKRTTKFDVIIGAAAYISQLTEILQGDNDTDVRDPEDFGRGSLHLCSISQISLTPILKCITSASFKTTRTEKTLKDKTARVMSTCVPVCKLETPKVPNPLVQGRKRHRRRGPRLTGVSKQRKSANARERNRVRVINNALEKLRDLIPLLPTEKRPSKIETVRLAALYIHHLTELL
ncbi:unnamed protein product, partial [Porites evermanni]